MVYINKIKITVINIFFKKYPVNFLKNDFLSYKFTCLSEISFFFIDFFNL